MPPKYERMTEPDRFYRDTPYPFSSTTNGTGTTVVPPHAYVKAKPSKPSKDSGDKTLRDQIHEIGQQISAAKDSTLSARDQAIEGIADYYGHPIDSRGAATLEDVASARAQDPSNDPGIMEQLFPRAAAGLHLPAGQGTGLGALLYGSAKDVGSLPGRALYALAAGGMDAAEGGRPGQTISRSMADPKGNDILESAAKDPLASLTLGGTLAGKYLLNAASETPGLVRAAAAAYRGLGTPAGKTIAAAAGGAGSDLGFQLANKELALRPDDVTVNPGSSMVAGGVAGLGAGRAQQSGTDAQDRITRLLLGKEEYGIPPQTLRNFIDEGLAARAYPDLHAMREAADLALTKANSRMENYQANKTALDQHLFTRDEGARDADWRQARMMPNRYSKHSNDMPIGYHDNDNGTSWGLSPYTVDRLNTQEPDGLLRVLRASASPALTSKINKDLAKHAKAQDLTPLAPTLGALLSSWAR